MSQAGMISTTVQNNTSPNQEISDFDDLISTNGSDIGKFDWNVSGNFSIESENGTATNPGILKIVFGGTGQVSVFPYQANSGNGQFVLGQGSLNLNYVFDLVALSDVVNTYTIYIGLMDGVSLEGATPPTDGCFFKYTDSVNSGNWQIICENASVSTTGNTSTLASTGFHNYGIQINSNATSVSFFIDGVQVASSPIASNIPTTQLNPAIFIDVTAGAPSDMLFDLFYYHQILVAAR